MRIEIHGALAAALCLTMTTPVVAGVKIFGTNVSKDDICPGASTSKCVQESLGATGTYVGSSRRYVNIDTKGTPDFAEYLARTYHRSLPKGQPYCRGQTDNVLQSYAERVGIPLFETPLQSTIDFKVKAKKLIDVGAGFDAVKVANAAGVPPTQTENVAAAISVAYRRVRSKDIVVSGTYMFVELNPDIFTALNADNAPDDIKACKAWLVDNREKIFASLNGFKLHEATASSELTSSFSSRLKASVGDSVSDAQIANIEAAFSSEMERKSELSFSPFFQLLSVSVYPARW